MAAGFFRKAALEKLSTPEKLDQLIKVTSPKGWITLLTIAIALATGITWSFLGNVKTKLNVVGVLLGGEVHEVVATSRGQIVELKVKVGDRVEKNDIVAVISQPEVLQRIEAQKILLANRKHDLQQLLAYGSQGANLQEDFINQSRLSINSQIETGKKNIVFLTNQLNTEKKLLEKGLITQSQVIVTEQNIESAKNNIEQLKSRLAQMSTQKLDIDYDHQQRVDLQKQRINEVEKTIEFLLEEYDILTNVRSSYSGEIIELLTDKGSVTIPGTRLFKLKQTQEGLAQSGNSKLKGVLYIPSHDGKKIKEGMEALVVPSTVQPQEFGFMKGKITYVSDFPITQKGMMMTVKNDQLVNGLLSKGALFEVYVEFEKDENSYSGFKWTSAQGPNILINEGTSCMGKVTVKSEPPIAMVIPALKKFFDLY